MAASAVPLSVLLTRADLPRRQLYDGSLSFWCWPRVNEAYGVASLWVQRKTHVPAHILKVRGLRPFVRHRILHRKLYAPAGSYRQWQI